MEASVHVELNGGTVHAGTLFAHRRRGAESATFSYANSYVGLSGAYSFDPELPLSASPRQTRLRSSLFGAFADCAPDRWGRTLLDGAENAAARSEGRSPRSLGEIDYLLGVRDDLRQGAVRFRAGRGAGAGPFLADEAYGVPALTDLPGLMRLAERAEADTADLPDLLRLVHVGSSLGGARPKAHVIGANGALAIAKFPSAAHDTWNVMAWEKVALDLARAAGIVVPRAKLLRLAGRSVLVIDRFDRRSDGARIGYRSALTALEAADGDRRSYLEIAEVIESQSDRPTAELEQLWRRIVFSVLISNTDDHLRNHGFLHNHDESWRLSPAFDLNPNPAGRHLTTAIDFADDTASIRLACSVASYFRLDQTRARQILHEIVVAVSSWRKTAGRCGLAAREIEPMAPAFRALQSLPA